MGKAVQNTIQQKSYCKEYKKLREKLYSYRDLKDNWDGYGGVRPKEEIVLTTEKFINSMQDNAIIPPKIMVAGSGQIALFWKNKADYIEVDFEDEGTFSYFCKINGRVQGYDDIQVNGKIPEYLYACIGNIHSKNATDKLKNKSFIGTDIALMPYLQDPSHTLHYHRHISTFISTIML